MKLPSKSFATALLTLMASAGFSQAAVLYTISSFDPTDATTPSSTTVDYDPALVAITTAPGLTGTTAVQLGQLQTINSGATTGTAVPGDTRFRNTDVDGAQTNGTLLVDATAATLYFQFGISGGNSSLTLTDLVFQAKRGTTGAATRGYNVVFSINGGAYTALGSGNLTTDRNTGAFDTITLPLTDTNVSSVDFRVNSTGGGVEYANFTLNGVPEPSTSMLGLLSVVGLLGIRRRG